MNKNDKVTLKKFFSIQCKVLKEIFKYYKFETISILILNTIVVFSEIINLKFLEYLTDNIAFYYKEMQNIKKIFFIVLLFFLMLITLHLIESIYNFLKAKYINKITFEVEKKIINKLADISYEFYENNSFYEKIYLANDVSNQYYKGVFGITELLRIIILLITYGIFLSKINILFIFIITISIIVSIIVSIKVTDKQLDFWRKYVSPVTRKNNYFKGIVTSRINQKNIQNTRSIEYFIVKYNYYNNKERFNYLKLNFLSFLSEIGSTIFFVISFLMITIIIGKGVVNLKFNIGFFSMSIAMLMNLFIVVKQFSLFMMNNNWHIRTLEAYYDIINTKDFNAYYKMSNKSNLIDLIDISYKYNNTDNYALKNINLKFNEGEKISIVGVNGSGKTTLISIILELFKNYEGVYIKNEIYYSSILQDYNNYQLSIKENIEIGCGGEVLTENEIYDLLRKVDLYDFIINMPNGIYTKLGQLENGVEFSVGQWQRLAICRLLANKKANVWILDEPTAYQDPISEIELYKLVFSLSNNKLVFFISHRLGFSKFADKIMVVDNGKVVEYDTHNNLMRKPNGLYAKMFNIQKSWYK